MDEYIKRELAIEALSRGEGCGNVCRRAIERVLAADVAPVRHGMWSRFYKSGVEVDEGFVSSCCDMWNERRTHYCPNCGCLMDGGDD